MSNEPNHNPPIPRPPYAPSTQATSSRAVWHYERDGQPAGPFRLEELRDLADKGLITPATILTHQNGTRMSAS
ncbi:MAG: DUF4339 domain-containing protein, partial [Planctomycetaceae bacterium]|nr:DUF4339 domain-containing protein [Planctomycetaceae bacterium]